jgi:hypothetical protein
MMDQEGQLTRHNGTDRRVDNKRCRSCDNFLYVFKGAPPARHGQKGRGC